MIGVISIVKVKFFIGKMCNFNELVILCFFREFVVNIINVVVWVYGWVLCVVLICNVYLIYSYVLNMFMYKSYCLSFYGWIRYEVIISVW